MRKVRIGIEVAQIWIQIGPLCSVHFSRIDLSAVE